MVRAFLQGKHSRSKLIDFYNDYLAEPFIESEEGEGITEDVRPIGQTILNILEMGSFILLANIGIPMLKMGSRCPWVIVDVKGFINIGNTRRNG